MLYAVIAANEAAVATKIALARNGFETRLMAGPFRRGLGPLFDFHDRSAAPKVRARHIGGSAAGQKRSNAVAGGRIVRSLAIHGAPETAD